MKMVLYSISQQRKFFENFKDFLTTMIERFKGLSKSLGAVETFYLFSEDLY